MSMRLVLLMAAFTVACSPEPSEPLLPPPPPPMTPDPDPPKPDPDLTLPFFDKTRVMEVEIEIDPADWDILRVQSRDIFDLLGREDCQERPFGSPFTYFPGTVTIDGETLVNVGVRKKGFIGSLDEVRPSLKLKFDEYVRDRRFNDFKRMTLNNVRQDPSAIKQCLAYGLYEQAGVLAPRCAFAHVTVNGQDLGIYAHVDGIKKRFLRMHFDDDEGDLWEGTVSDFRPGWTGTFEQKTNREIAASKERILDVSTALDVPDAQLIGELEGLIDLDGFLSYWAIESLVVHWDGYAGNTNNFFIYDDPTSQRFNFIAWGVDAAFGIGQQNQQPVIFAQSMLSRRLYDLPAGRDLIFDRMETILDTVWDESAIQAEINRMEALITDSQAHRPELAGAIDDVRTFVRTRRAEVEAEIATGGRDITNPLRETFCFVERGNVTVDLATTFGTLGAPDPFAVGTSTLTGIIDEIPLADVFPGGATSGLNEEQDALLVAITVLDNTPSFLITAISMPPNELRPQTLDLDRPDIEGFLLYVPAPGQEAQYAGTLARGTVEVEAGSTSDGAAVRAYVEAEIF